MIHALLEIIRQYQLDHRTCRRALKCDLCGEVDRLTDIITQRANGIEFHITEEERQLLLMAMGHLAAYRPGFLYALSSIAIRIDNITTLYESAGDGLDRRYVTGAMFDSFRRGRLAELPQRHSTQPTQPTERRIKI